MERSALVTLLGALLLIYRQPDQKVAGKLLHAVPEDIYLETNYGINAEVAVPIVEMMRSKASFSSKGAKR